MKAFHTSLRQAAHNGRGWRPVSCFQGGRHRVLCPLLLGITLAFGAFACFGQTNQPDNSAQSQPGQWRRTTDPPPSQPSLQGQPADTGSDATMSAPDDAPGATAPQGQGQDQGAPPPPPANNGGWQNGPGQPPSQGGWNRFGNSRPMPPPRRDMPPTMTLPAGTWVSFRVNEPISSDHSQTGDAFMGTLAEPLVVNGLVLARRGQLVSGRVTEAQKAGRVSGLSKLGIELTQIGIADGQQINVHTQMVERRGPTSYGRDAAAIGATTATGAAIGAGVNGGVGAGVGAAAGLVASTVGVMLTRGRPTVLYPEQVVTFQLVNPVTVTADFNNEAFQPVGQQDYRQGSLRQGYGTPGYGAPGYYASPGYYGGYYGYGYPYPYWGPYYSGWYPYFWGPGISFGFYGRGFYGGHYYGGGFHGRR